MGYHLRNRRIVIRWARRVGVVLLLAGLTGFQLHIQQREPPLVQIADIKPYMNFSVITVQGRLASEPFRLRSGSILFTVDDGTGTIAVFSDTPYQILQK